MMTPFRVRENCGRYEVVSTNVWGIEYVHTRTRTSHEAHTVADRLNHRFRHNTS